jgi:hypothetical protein
MVTQLSLSGTQQTPCSETVTVLQLIENPRASTASASLLGWPAEQHSLAASKKGPPLMEQCQVASLGKALAPAWPAEQSNSADSPGQSSIQEGHCREQMFFIKWLHVRLYKPSEALLRVSLFLYFLALCCKCDRGKRATSAGHAGVWVRGRYAFPVD